VAAMIRASSACEERHRSCSEKATNGREKLYEAQYGLHEGSVLPDAARLLFSRSTVCHTQMRCSASRRCSVAARWADGLEGQIAYRRREQTATTRRPLAK